MRWWGPTWGRWLCLVTIFFCIFIFLFSTSFHPSIFPISWNSPSAQMTIFARLSRWIQPLWASRVNLTIMHEYDQRPMRPELICAQVSYQTKCRNVWLRCIASSGHHRHHHQAWFKYLNKASTSVFNIPRVEKYWPIIVKGVEMFPNGLTWLPTTWSSQSPSTLALSPAVITADHHHCALNNLTIAVVMMMSLSRRAVQHHINVCIPT